MSDDETDLVDGVSRDPTLRIPVCGERVAATRYSPADREGPHPALLMYVPYPKDDVITFGAYAPLVRYLAAHGYEVVVANMVGTGGSTGHVEEMFTRREGREPAAIVEWLADREWTTGRVGMFGKSYGGITALDAAAQRPDPLEAIIPIHTPYQGYRNAYTHGGAFELLNIGMNWLTLMQALDVRPPSRRDDEAGWAAWRDRLAAVRDRDPWLFQFLDHDPDDAFWDDKDIPVERIDTPTLAVGGYRDSYTRDTLEYFEAVDAPKRLLLGPWRHTMPHRGRESAVDLRLRALEWFDRFLKDRDTDALAGEHIEYWTGTRGSERVDGGVWRERRTWPRLDDGAETVRLAASPDGLVDAGSYEAGAVDREYEFDHTVGVASVPTGNAGVAPTDTTPDDRRSLTFETDPLSAPLELTGTGRIGVRRESSVAPHVFSARVVDVAPDGSGRLVTHGTVRLADEGTTDEVLRVPLQPRSHVFEAGHRIRLSLAAAHFPVTRPENGHGAMTVRSTPSAPTRLSFPGRERSDAGDVTFEDRVAMPAPDPSSTTVTPFRRDGSSGWAVTREHTTDGVEVRKEVDAVVDLPHAASMRRSARSRAAVDPRDPTTASASNRLELVTDYGDEVVRVVAENRIGNPATAVETRVEVGDATVFEERWVR
jgi:putative CocE/NonD family hydrolase